jgi:hypothetical protein
MEMRNLPPATFEEGVVQYVGSYLKIWEMMLSGEWVNVFLMTLKIMKVS